MNVSLGAQLWLKRSDVSVFLNALMWLAGVA
jgi:hypothetical protein